MSYPVYKLEVLPGREGNLGSRAGVMHWSAGGEQSYCASLFWGLLFLFLSFLFTIIIFYFAFNYQTLLISTHKSYF